MDTSHVNGHVGHGKKLVDHTRHPATHVARKVSRRGRRTGHKPERSATSMIHSGERRLATSTRGILGWVRSNPKTAVGIGVGVGVAAAALANPKLVRAAALTLGGLAYAAIKRFI